MHKTFLMPTNVDSAQHTNMVQSFELVKKYRDDADALWLAWAINMLTKL